MTTNIDNLPAPTENLSKQDRLIGLLLTDQNKTPLNELARMAGYSDTYADHSVHSLVKSDSFQRRLVEAYKASNTVMLPRVLRITDKALEKYEDNPELAIYKPQFLQNVQRVTGVIQDQPSQVNVIHVDSLTVVQSGLSGHYEHVQDGEIVE